MNEKTLVLAAITACVAQLVEQRIRNAQVAGSSPAASSIDPSEKSEGFLLYLSKFTHAYGPYRRAGCPQKVNCSAAAREATLGCPAVSLDFSPPKSESFLFSPSKTGGIGGLRAARPTGFGRDNPHPAAISAAAAASKDCERSSFPAKVRHSLSTRARPPPSAV